MADANLHQKPSAGKKRNTRGLFSPSGLIHPAVPLLDSVFDIAHPIQKRHRMARADKLQNLTPGSPVHGRVQ
jgi:hypothetical protein